MDQYPIVGRVVPDEANQKLAAALAKAQKVIQAPPKNKKVDFQPQGKARVKYAYADLADCIAAVRDPLADNGLAISHSLLYTDGIFGLSTVLLHDGGGVLESFYPLPDPKKESIRPQEFGSALTYARRYSLCCLVGIASDDDDDGASGAETTPPKQQQRQPSPPVDKQKVAAEAKKQAEDKATGSVYNKAKELPQDPFPDYENEQPTITPRQYLANLAEAKFIDAKEMGQIIQRVTGRKVKSSALTQEELNKVIVYVDGLASNADPDNRGNK